MSRFVGPRVQIVAVVLLFLGALAVLVYNLFVALGLPQQELRAREDMRRAGRWMADAAVPLLATPVGAPADTLNQGLREVSAQVLADFPGIEGGFYVADGTGAFAGYAYPTSTHPQSDAVPRTDPPPLEIPVILNQIQTTLDKGTTLLRTEDVGPSRVIILTQPVGDRWPARLSVWLLYRLTGPDQLAGQLHRTEVSTGLALAGMLIGLVLTWNLNRSLQRQHNQQQRLQDELRRAEHLAALGKLLAGVAHEVRNPLAAIRSTVQLWQRLPETTRTADSLASLVGAVDRINALVGRLLLFARADTAEREPVDLNGILTETLELIGAKAGEQGVVLETDCAAELPSVLGSAAGLRQVALNLLTNSLQAMPGGGRLRCTTRALPGRRSVEVRIADTGPGIAAEVRPHLFEPFFTTRADGTGLGLALCREIVLDHGGTIELVDEPGTVFRVILPGV